MSAPGISQTMVIKLGGSILEDDAVRGAALDAIARAHRSGRRIVVVHGGGKRIDGWLGRLGIPKRSHAGLRVTDAPTREVVVAVLAGLVSKSLVAELAARGVRAAGISGVDGGCLSAPRHEAVDGIDLGWVAAAPRADATMLEAIAAAGCLPLVASIALGADGQILNVNADAAAAAVAGALGAQRLLFLTDVEAVRDARGLPVGELSTDEAAALLATGAITAGMRPKLGACLRALELGVHEVAIAGPSRHAAALDGGACGTSIRALSPAACAGATRAGRSPRLIPS